MMHSLMLSFRLATITHTSSWITRRQEAVVAIIVSFLNDPTPEYTSSGSLAAWLSKSKIWKIWARFEPS